MAHCVPFPERHQPLPKPQTSVHLEHVSPWMGLGLEKLHE